MFTFQFIALCLLGIAFLAVMFISFSNAFKHLKMDDDDTVAVCSVLSIAGIIVSMIP